MDFVTQTDFDPKTLKLGAVHHYVDGVEVTATEYRRRWAEKTKRINEETNE